MTVICPDCEIEFEIPEDAQIGEILDCENCGAEMEIINLDPIKIKLIEDEK